MAKADKFPLPSAPVVTECAAGRALGMNVALQARMGECRSVFVFEKILHLGVMITDWADVCDQIVEFVEEINDCIIDDLKPRIDLSRLADDEDDEDERLHEFVSCCLAGKHFGFLVHVKAPEVIRLSIKGSKQINAGICTLRWFYGENLLDIVDEAEAWALSLENIRAK